MDCIERDALVLTSLVEAPFAGTDAIANHVAYYTRLRTIGVLPAGAAAAEADAQLRSLGGRSVLARTDLEITRGLLQTPGYRLAGEAAICGAGYSVLSVPR